MSNIGFIGIGKMGLPMMGNLISSGHSVIAYDLSSEAIRSAVKRGAASAKNIEDAINNREIIITMLPAGEDIREVYLNENGIISKAKEGTLFIDCSTVDIDSAVSVSAEALVNGMEMVDAPVSGGVRGAEQGTLTFMVGGSELAFTLANPILKSMGKNVVHAGDAGRGQAAKICNNLLLGISMAAVCEAFALADKLGLDRQTLFNISSNATGQCWALNSYCPVPGPVPTSPANNQYAPGFTSSMMLKDLALSQVAANSVGLKTELGAHAERLYRNFCESGNADIDFSGIFEMIKSNDLDK